MSVAFVIDFLNALRLPDHAIFDWDSMCAALASTRPWWTPGEAHGYHTNTFGFLVGEPVCRVLGTTFDRALAQVTTGPAGAPDLLVGLPPSERDRCAEVDVFGADVMDLVPGPGDGDEDSLLAHHAYFNPPTMSGMGVVDTAPWREAMVPSTNGHAAARSVAAFYAALLPSAGQPCLLSEPLLREATSVQAKGVDRVLGRPSRFGLGFMLHQDERGQVGGVAETGGRSRAPDACSPPWRSVDRLASAVGSLASLSGSHRWRCFTR